MEKIRIKIDEPGSDINNIEFPIPTIKRNKIKPDEKKGELKIDSNILSATQELITEIEKDGQK